MKDASQVQVSPTGRPRRARSQAMVELALVLPVSLLIMMGVLDFGRAYLLNVSVQQGAREAARFASTAASRPIVTDTLIRQRLIESSAPAMGGVADTCTSGAGCTDAMGTVWTITVTPSGTKTAGSPVTVTAEGQLPLFTGFLTGYVGMSTIRLFGSATFIVY